MRFTRKGKVLYAILPLRPPGPLTIRDLRLAPGARVGLLGSTHADLAWRQRGADLVIALPTLRDAELPFEGPLCLRIEGIPP